MLQAEHKSERHSEHKSERIDWSQLWYPGPAQVFSPSEMAAAGTDRPSRTFVVILLINVAVLAQGVLQLAPPALTARLTGLLVALAVLGWQGGMALWWRPTRKRLAWLTGALMLAFVVLALGFKWRVPDAEQRHLLVSVVGLGMLALLLGFWFVAVFRAQQIAGRLREIAERAHAQGLQAQLTQAQIQPHFLFNSLASLQHWVETHDERAAPLLRSLTGYLRATLPLFNREQLRLGEELAAVRHYLAVMRTRLGPRLQIDIDVPAPLQERLLPPALLLTLVENAIEHGVVAKLGEARVSVRAQEHGGVLLIEVTDDGPGLSEPGPGPQAGRGVGLSNSRLRLAQAYGGRASLSLENASAGGCIARLRLPLQTQPQDLKTEDPSP
jgi:signal transduction histidine kinase